MQLAGSVRPSGAVPKTSLKRQVATNATAQSTKPVIPAAETMKLGRSDLEVSLIGVGGWSWGDSSGYWQDGSKDKTYGKAGAREAWDAMQECGINFLDTAEVYGFNLSEKYIGEFDTDPASAQSPIIATKFAPLPWRQTSGSLVDACKASLARLQTDQVGLYMQHWPGFFLNAFANDNYLKGLAECQQQGLCKAVGVSNFNAERIRNARKFLDKEGVPLASNQVQYSLIYRAPDENGVFEACRENGVTLVAYSPLAQGLLTGKYSVQDRPRGQRSINFTEDRTRRCEALVKILREVGEEHGGKTPAQVAINWVICKGALPIPGVKNAKQVREAAGAFGWRLTEGEILTMEDAARGIQSTGAPFEKW
ncbi:unnamed protein product [Pedinophyceae sp. YPF-701]|nr:unnamed protein product [Pedinophyceae sp. YPF-701]